MGFEVKWRKHEEGSEQKEFAHPQGVAESTGYDPVIRESKSRVLPITLALYEGDISLFAVGKHYLVA